jgi:hypothetical protein
MSILDFLQRNEKYLNGAAFAPVLLQGAMLRFLVAVAVPFCKVHFIISVDICLPNSPGTDKITI